jgi:(E)-4-hydroxy-3-methylbut-2-enyl-diphosphate synthase
MESRLSLPVQVGTLTIGGGNPIAVQTMWKEPLTAIDSTVLNKISHLSNMGCELLRFAVPDLESAQALGELAGRVKMVLVADVHFDYRIALRCMDFPIAKIRINPGNIGAAWKAEEVIKKAEGRGIPLRIGVNAGSLPRVLSEDKNIAEAMVKAAEMELEILEKYGFNRVIFSLKSSDIDTTVAANILFSEKYNYPLHLGVTEAGPLVQGVVKNTLAVSSLLKKRVGDTIRISLSDSMENEIIAAKAILQSLGLRKIGVELISCPTCGRTVFDVKAFLDDVKYIIHKFDKKATIAVMGCPVNGPGEARQADLGITGAGNSVIIFRKGKIVRRVSSEQALKAFKEEVNKI